MLMKKLLMMLLMLMLRLIRVKFMLKYCWWILLLIIEVIRVLNLGQDILKFMLMSMIVMVVMVGCVVQVRSVQFVIIDSRFMISMWWVLKWLMSVLLGFVMMRFVIVMRFIRVLEILRLKLWILWRQMIVNGSVILCLRVWIVMVDSSQCFLVGRVFQKFFILIILVFLWILLMLLFMSMFVDCFVCFYIFDR